MTTGTYYRIQDASRDASELLSERNWVSRVWYDATVSCESCQGLGEVWTSRDAEYPEACGTCRGSGARNLSDMPRRGVSACGSVRELAAYFEAHHGQLDEDSVVVELEGDLADDEDFDADAVLILPSRVVSVTPAGEFAELAALI